MSFYNGKLLELLSINSESENPYILIRLMFSEVVDIKWEIDVETTKHLKALIEPNKNYKYRLSFQTTAMPTINSYYSWLTKTQGDVSENIYFTCSKTFVDGLESIKTSTSLDDLIQTSQFTVIQKKVDKVHDINKSESANKLLKKARLVVSIGVAAAFLLVYSGQSYNYEPALAKKATIAHTIPNQPLKYEIPKSKGISEAGYEPISTFNINKTITSYVPEDSVALTFDDGPSKHTKDIVNILKKNHVGGTFFFIGQNIKKLPDLVKYVDAGGYTIGNHSMNHPDLSKLSYQKQQQEISETNQLIEQLTGEPVTLFRPPYEAKNQSTINLMQDEDMSMVLWDRDPRDWQTNDPNDILQYIKDSRASGTIILLHESQITVDALQSVIDYLKSQHLHILNLTGDRHSSL